MGSSNVSPISCSLKESLLQSLTMSISSSPTQGYILSIVGGRMVSARQGVFPVNGQQLMMQVDSLTCSMTGMTVNSNEEKMETGDQEPLQQKCYQQPELKQQQQQEQQQQGPDCQRERGGLLKNPDKEVLSGPRCALWI